MESNRKYSDEFLIKCFEGCVNNKTEILNGEICGCYNCLKVSQTKDIVEWISEPNGKEDSAACPNCTFDSVLSSNYPIQDILFLKEMSEFHFES